MISKDKKYRFRGYETEYVLLDIHEDRVFGRYKDGSFWHSIIHTLEGNFNLHSSVYDLVEISPYENFKIDDKVLVWSNGMTNYKYKRHFAGISPKSDKPLAFNSGRSSFTMLLENRDGDTQEWDFCEKYIDNE